MSRYVMYLREERVGDVHLNLSCTAAALTAARCFLSSLLNNILATLISLYSSERPY